MNDNFYRREPPIMIDVPPGGPNERFIIDPRGMVGNERPELIRRITPDSSQRSSPPLYREEDFRSQQPPYNMPENGPVQYYNQADEFNQPGQPPLPPPGFFNPGLFTLPQSEIHEPQGKGKKITDKEDSKIHGWFKPVIAEFLATMLFVFIGCAQAMSGGITATAMAHGLTIGVLVASLAMVSGGHINPAVTLAIMIAGGISIKKGIMYIVAQLLGSVVGAAIFWGGVGTTNYHRMLGGMTLYNSQMGLTAGQAFLCETFFTSLLIFVVLMMAIEQGGKNPTTGLYIGFSIVAAIFAGGKISGASLNPARTFGPALLYTIVARHVWNGQWVFYIATMTGAIVTALLYRFIFKTKHARSHPPRRFSFWK